MPFGQSRPVSSSSSQVEVTPGLIGGVLSVHHWPFSFAWGFFFWVFFAPDLSGFKKRLVVVRCLLLFAQARWANTSQQCMVLPLFFTAGSQYHINKETRPVDALFDRPPLFYNYHSGISSKYVHPTAPFGIGSTPNPNSNPSVLHTVIPAVNSLASFTFGWLDLNKV